MTQLPQEMRDLLIRLDTKVDGITDTLARMDRRADNHEQRLDNHETRIHTIETTASTAQRIGGWLWAVFGGGVIAMGGFLISLFNK